MREGSEMFPDGLSAWSYWACASAISRGEVAEAPLGVQTLRMSDGDIELVLVSGAGARRG